MNSFLQQNSKFGSPYAKYNNNNIQYEIYRTNSFNNEVNFPFSGYVNGGRAAFGMHSLYYNQTTNRVEEKSPNPFSTQDFSLALNKAVLILKTLQLKMDYLIWYLTLMILM